MDPDYDALAIELLGDAAAGLDAAPVPRALPVPTEVLAARALRIAGVYAALWLEEPFLYRWGGIAAFVSLQIHRALHVPRLTLRPGVFSGELAPVLADTNLAVYRHMVPLWLRFRVHRHDDAPLPVGFDLLRRADELAARNLESADRTVYASVSLLSHEEQANVVQPRLASLSAEAQRGLAPFYLFRMGWDGGAPTSRFDGKNPVDLGQRWAWTTDEVLPWCWRQFRERPEELRADANRLRRSAGVRLPW